MHLSPAAFYDMSLNEWFAALDGFAESNGIDTTPPPTLDDLDHLTHRMGPTPSIKRPKE